MGDGIVRRIAVILNGDTEERHLQNVDRASKLLGEKGYDLYVASPKQPQGKTTLLAEPTQKGVEKILKDLEGKLDDDDELFIYTTGHGGDEGGGCLGLKDTCLEKDSPAFKKLFSLPYGKRTVVMSQCYGGNWAKLYINDPKTLFVSAGSKGEKSCCQLFDPFFFGADAAIADMNGDGTISWSERYRSALRREQIGFPVYIAGTRYKDTGISGTNEELPHFAAKVHEAKKLVEYKKLLATLKPGDVAVTMVSASWCPACKIYLPTFKKLAKEARGRILFVFVPEVDDEISAALKVSTLPHLSIVDHMGKHIKIDNRDDPLAERWKLVGTQWSDWEYCLLQVKRDATSWQYIDAALKKDFTFILAAIKQNAEVTKYVGPEFFKNRQNVIQAVMRNGLALAFLDARWKKDHEVVLNAVASNAGAWLLADPVLKSDNEFIKLAIKVNGMMLGFAPEELRSDPKFVLTAVREFGSALAFASPDLRKDKKIVLVAVGRNGKALQYADAQLQKDHDVVLAAVKNDGLALEFADELLQKNTEIVYAAVMQNGLALEFADPVLRKNKKIVREAVKKHGFAYRYADRSLKKDRALALLGLGHKGRIAQFSNYLGYNWVDERPVPSFVFQYTDYSLKKDATVVLSAVEQDGLALELAHPSIKKNKKIVMAAVKQNGLALEHADAMFRSDLEIVQAAVKQNPDALEFADPKFKKDPVILKILADRGD